LVQHASPCRQTSIPASKEWSRKNYFTPGVPMYSSRESRGQNKTTGTGTRRTYHHAHVGCTSNQLCPCATLDCGFDSTRSESCIKTSDCVLTHQISCCSVPRLGGGRNQDAARLNEYAIRSACRGTDCTSVTRRRVSRESRGWCLGLRIGRRQHPFPLCVLFCESSISVACCTIPPSRYSARRLK
jgi:hypothetical protein